VTNVQTDTVSPSELQPDIKFGRGPERPLVALIVLYPLWWALGLSVLIFQIIAIPMLVHLLRNRHSIKVPPGFGFWVAFLGWAALSLVMVWYSPPGTADDPVAQRTLVALFRYTQYFAMGVILLFVGNLPRARLSADRFGWLLGLAYAYGVVGGLLAVLAPRFEFTSPVEFLLPGNLASEPWVASMVHPSLAQVQDFIGEEVGRPAAPFGYTNMWGAVLAMLLPWFFTTWVLRATGHKRMGGIALLALGVIPIIVSLNRGLWIALVVIVVITAWRELLAGRPTVVIGLLGAIVVALPLIALSPLGGLVQQRLDNPHSNALREVTTERALEISVYSPLLGYGTTRDMVGSNQSIAIGKTPECPKCGNVPLGQNGQFWMVLVSQGWVGVVLFYGMFVTVVLRWWRTRAPLVAAGTLSVLICLLMSFYYDMIIVPLAFLVLSVGALWLSAREHDERSVAT
jgi:polysaccharide biosynthesis protein PslJ